MTTSYSRHTEMTFNSDTNLQINCKTPTPNTYTLRFLTFGKFLTLSTHIATTPRITLTFKSLWGIIIINNTEYAIGSCITFAPFPCDRNRGFSPRLLETCCFFFSPPWSIYVHFQSNEAGFFLWGICIP